MTKLWNILQINGIDISEYLNGGSAEYYATLKTSLNYMYNITGDYSSASYNLQSDYTFKGKFNLNSNTLNYNNLNIEANNLNTNTFSITDSDTSINHDLYLKLNNFNNNSINNSNQFYNNSIHISALNISSNTISYINKLSISANTILNNILNYGNFKIDCDKFENNNLNGISTLIDTTESTVGNIKLTASTMLNNSFSNLSCVNISISLCSNSVPSNNLKSFTSNITTKDAISSFVQITTTYMPLSYGTTTLTSNETSTYTDFLTSTFSDFTMFNVSNPTIANTTNISSTFYSFSNVEINFNNIHTINMTCPAEVFNNVFTNINSLNINCGKFYTAHSFSTESTTGVSPNTSSTTLSFTFNYTNCVISCPTINITCSNIYNANLINNEKLNITCHSFMYNFIYSLQTLQILNYNTFHYNTLACIQCFSISGNNIYYNYFLCANNIAINANTIVYNTFIARSESSRHVVDNYLSSLETNNRININGIVFKSNIVDGYTVFTKYINEINFNVNTVGYNSFSGINIGNIKGIVQERNIYYNINTLSIMANSIYGFHYITSINYSICIPKNNTVMFYYNTTPYIFTGNKTDSSINSDSSTVTFTTTITSTFTDYLLVLNSINSSTNANISTTYKFITYSTNFNSIYSLSLNANNISMNTFSLVGSLCINCSRIGTTSNSSFISDNVSYTRQVNTRFNVITACDYVSLNNAFVFYLNVYNAKYLSMNNYTCLYNFIYNVYDFNIICYGNYVENTVNICRTCNLECHDIRKNVFNLLLTFNFKVSSYTGNTMNGNFNNINKQICYILGNVSNNYTTIIPYNNGIIDAEICDTNVFNNINILNVKGLEFIKNTVSNIQNLNCNQRLYNSNTFENITNLNCMINGSAVSNTFSVVQTLNISGQTISKCNLYDIKQFNIDCVSVAYLTFNYSISETNITNIKNININANDISYIFTYKCISNLNIVAVNSYGIGEVWQHLTNSLQAWITNSSYTDINISTVPYKQQALTAVCIDYCYNVNIKIRNCADLMVIRNCFNCTVDIEYESFNQGINSIIFYNVKSIVFRKGITYTNNSFIFDKVGTDFESSLIPDWMNK